MKQWIKIFGGDGKVPFTGTYPPLIHTGTIDFGRLDKFRVSDRYGPEFLEANKYTVKTADAIELSPDLAKYLPLKPSSE